MGTLNRLIDFAISPSGLVAIGLMFWGTTFLPFSWGVSFAAASFVSYLLFKNYHGEGM